MTYADFMQLVGSVGFPIVCCGYMMVVNNKTVQELTDAVNKLSTIISAKMGGGDVM